MHPFTHRFLPPQAFLANATQHAFRPIGAIALAALLGGCGADDNAQDRYPVDWPKLTRVASLFSRDKPCPNLSGTYAYSNVGDGSAFALSSTALADGARTRDDAPWVSMTIAGDAHVALTVTMSRANTRTTTGSTVALSDTNTLLHGTHYTCKDGWLIGMPRNMSITRAGRPESAAFRRDVDGGLVARAHIREFRVLSLWAETGAGIPYWSDMRTYWAHWMPNAGTRSPLAMGRASPSELAAMGRLEREAYLLENGLNTSATPSPAGSATSANKGAKASAPRLDFEEMRSLVKQRVDRNAVLEDFRHDGMRYVITIRVSARAQIGRTLENFHDEPEFVDVRDDSMGGYNGAKAVTADMAKISFRSR